MIKSLMYVMNYTGLDITYSVNKLSRFTNNLSMNNWKAINIVIKYLIYTLDYELYYTSYLMVVDRYSDAN